MIDLGWLGDERLDQPLDWLARSITGAGIALAGQQEAAVRYYRSGNSAPGFACRANNHLPCAWGAIKALLALSKVPDAGRTPAIQVALDHGAMLETGCKVERVVIEQGKATGVVARKGLIRRFYPADLVILAAGGLGTPVILQNSGIPCEPRLFVEPVLTVAALWPNALQCKEIEMPFVVQREQFMLSPYFDHLSFFFNKAWQHPAKDILGIMIKLADASVGSISRRTIEKRLTAEDRQSVGAGVDLCKQILRRFDVKEEDIFLGTINAGHPGGMLPLTAARSSRFTRRGCRPISMSLTPPCCPVRWAIHPS